jgi:hypothetical protein
MASAIRRMTSRARLKKAVRGMGGGETGDEAQKTAEDLG